jgi:hypothetical protein
MRRFLVVPLLVLIAGTVLAVDPGDTVAISVREAEVRAGAGFLSPISGRLGYGTSVNVLSVNGDWVQIEARDEGVSGWLHSVSVLPPREMKLTGDAIGQGASTEEIALAGRGFSEQIENEYKEQKQLDFDAVDEMEQLVLPIEELGAFLEQIDATIDGGNS